MFEIEAISTNLYIKNKYCLTKILKSGFYSILRIS